MTKEQDHKGSRNQRSETTKELGNKRKNKKVTKEQCNNEPTKPLKGKVTKEQQGH